MPAVQPTILQCDFDGTITTEDVSFMLLDTFAQGDWRGIHEEYHAAHLSVGEFNSRVFSLVKTGRENLLRFLRGRVKIRPGLVELARVCEKKNIRFVIVSNGLDFYIEQILKDAGLDGIEFHAARTEFHPTGMEVAYIGPDGAVCKDGFKGIYARRFCDGGGRLIYAGDGFSDAGAARLANRIFAIDGLLKYCRETALPCATFETLTDIAREIEKG